MGKFSISIDWLEFQDWGMVGSNIQCVLHQYRKVYEPLT